jgi:spoIIIJ-associated protein
VSEVIREARAEGRTVAEAKRRIVAELGLPEDAIRFFVLDEGRPGFLGIGARPAVVIGQALVEEPAKAPKERPGRVVRASAAPAVDTAVTEGKAEEAEALPDGWEEAAKAFLEGFLTTVGQPATVQVERRPDHVFLSADGDYSWLCRARSDALDSLQYLTQVAVARRYGRKSARPRIVIDLGGFRARRAQELETLARQVAEKVRTSGKPARLEVMPPSERRIVHMVLQSEPGVETRSEGAEPNRYVVVVPERRRSG